MDKKYGLFINKSPKLKKPFKSKNIGTLFFRGFRDHFQASGKGEALYLAWMDSLEAFKAARAVCELLYYFVRQCIGKSLLKHNLDELPPAAFDRIGANYFE